MIDDEIALRAPLEKGSDATFLREMIGFAAERLMQLETSELCGAAPLERHNARARDAATSSGPSQCSSRQSPHRRTAPGSGRRMGSPERAIHDPGNHRPDERSSHWQLAQIGGLTPQLALLTNADPQSRLGTRPMYSMRYS